MANIPQYVSKVGATTEPPSGYMKPQKWAEERSPELAAKMGIGGALEQTGKLIATVADKMLEVQNANSESEANILVIKTMAAHEDEVDKNPDLNNALKDTPNKLQEMRKLGASKFVDPRARAKWEQDFDLKAIVYQNTLKTKVLKRQIDLGRANTLRELVFEKNNYIDTFTSKEENLSKDKMKQIMNKAVSLGLFTQEQGFDELNKIVKAAEEDKKKIKEANEKLAEKNKKIGEDIIKNQQNENYKSAMLEAFDGKLTIKTIQSLYRTDLINDVQRGKLESYIYYNLPTVDEDDLGVYNQIVQMQTEGEENPEEINDLILENASKNKLKNTSAKQLIGKTYTDYKNRKDELIALNAKEMRAVATEFFRDDIDEPDKERIETAVYSFHKRVQTENADGERITQIAQEIMTDTIRKEYPEINNIETINKVKEMFGIKGSDIQELPPPKSETQEPSPYSEYPDAFKENGVWKVIRKGQKYRIEE